MVKNSIGYIVELPNGARYVRYIEGHEALPNGGSKPIFKTLYKHYPTMRDAKAKLDELEKTLGAKLFKA